MTQITVNPHAIRAVTGCFGYAEKEIKGHNWQVAFYCVGEHVRLTKNGKEIAWDKAPSAARKFAYQAAEVIKSAVALAAQP